MPDPESEPFGGFPYPESNFFRLPNEWTNLTATMKTWAEHKVIEYVLRHTWGYQEYRLRKRITLDEFMHGRKRTDGTRIDQGTGMGKKAIIDGLRAAVEQGYLEEERDATDAARIRKSYALRMVAGGEAPSSIIEPQMCDDRTPEVRPAHPRGSPSAQRSEKDTVERHSKKGDPSPDRYSQGRYGVCPDCGCSPHDPDCPRAREAADG